MSKGNEAIEVPPDFLHTEIVPVMLRCEKCGTEGRASLYRINLGPFGSQFWWRVPDGWWLALPLIPPAPGSDTSWLPGCRCRSCFDVREAVAAAKRLRGEKPKRGAQP
jgi:hypothetical protein